MLQLKLVTIKITAMKLHQTNESVQQYIQCCTSNWRVTHNCIKIKVFVFPQSNLSDILLCLS